MSFSTSTYDFIIVGAGASGCLLANRLSADPTASVLLLEAGPPDRNFWLKVPIGFYRCMANERLSGHFTTEKNINTAGRTFDLPFGRVLGGSSSINGLVYHRGQKEDYDSWADAGGDIWSFESLLQAFKTVETYERPTSRLRGDCGELRVSEVALENPICQAWLAAAKENGLAKLEDYNSSFGEGVAPMQLTASNGVRNSSSAAFLRPVISRPNLQVLTMAKVTRIKIEKGTARGVEWISNGRTQSAIAERRVIVACGALQSPKLLMHSGVGPASILRKHDIEVAMDLPSVGQNLQDHYQVRTVMALKGKMSLNVQTRSSLNNAKMAWDWALNGKGPFSIGAAQAGAAACTEFAANNVPDIQMSIMPLSVNKQGESLHDFSGFTSSVWQARPHSRGVVALKSNDPLVEPRILTNYLSVDHDRKITLAGIKLLRKIYRTPTFSKHVKKEYLPDSNTNGDDSLLEFAKRIGNTTYHYCGTCKLGSADDAVVDPQLSVWGVQNLSVIDASVMPNITSGNILAPTLAIAEIGAKIVKQL